MRKKKKKKGERKEERRGKRKERNFFFNIYTHWSPTSLGFHWKVKNSWVSSGNLVENAGVQPWLSGHWHVFFFFLNIFL